MRQWQVQQVQQKERQFFRKGYGAFGHFQTICSMSPYTRACLFQREGQQTPVFVRLSLAFGTRGTPDSARNLRGFAVKFRTDGGIYDLLSRSFPVDAANTAKEREKVYETFHPDLKTNLYEPVRFWELAVENPNLLNFAVCYYSNLGTPYGFLNMCSYQVQTQIWENWERERFLVRCRFIPCAGEQLSSREEALYRAGFQPDAAGEELFFTLKKKKKIGYNLFIQIMPHENGNYLRDSPFDTAAVWPEETFPLRLVGRLYLEENPENYEKEVLPAKFSSENRIDGILPGEEITENKEEEKIYRQVRNTLKGFAFRERRSLTDNLARELQKVPPDLRKEALKLWMQADAEFGEELYGREQWYRRNEKEGGR